MTTAQEYIIFFRIAKYAMAICWEAFELMNTNFVSLFRLWKNFDHEFYKI